MTVYVLCTLVLGLTAIWQTLVVGAAKRLIAVQRAQLLLQGKTLTELHSECTRLTQRTLGEVA